MRDLINWWMYANPVFRWAVIGAAATIAWWVC